MIEQIECFLKNLQYQINQQRRKYGGENLNFCDGVKECFESFENIYYRDAYKQLMNEFKRSLEKKK